MKKLLLKYKDYVDRIFLPKIHPLRYLFLEITRVCNLSCSYCGSSCTVATQSNEMNCLQWISALEQIAADFKAPRIMVAVTGGEPLMKVGIFEILRALQRLEYRFGMVTNATLLNEQRARELVATGIGSISISLDGPAAVNDIERGTGTSAKTIRGIQHLQRAGYRGILEVISTITKTSYPHLEQTHQLLKKLGLKRWRVSPAFPLGRALDDSTSMLNGDELQGVLDFVRDKRRQGGELVPEYSDEGFLGCHYERQVRPYGYSCLAGITIGGIKADGAIGACPELGPEFDQGNVMHDRFSKVWHERYKKHRDRSWMKKGICANCSEFGPCRGNSLHLWDSAKDETRRCYKELLGEAFGR